MAKKAEQVVPEIIDSVEGLNAKMAAMREAQKVFATYTQEQVDKIFFAAASAANKMRIPLAKMAVEETGMGIVELRRSQSRSVWLQQLSQLPIQHQLRFLRH